MKNFRDFLVRNKKAMMGVSTLIIFISAILTSAVAAAVIVRTVGILQERSFTVTTEIRDRLVTALDVISVNGYMNTTTQKLWGVDVLVRTRSGSYPYSLLSAGLTFITPTTTVSAKLQHSENEDYGSDNTGYDVANLTTTAISLFDMDKDKRPETLQIVENADGANEILWFTFSRGDTANVTLGADISPGVAFISRNDTPIIGDSGKWYGFVQIQGDSGYSAPNYWLGQGSADNSTDYFRITHYPERDWCDFSMLIPEEAYCYDTRLGDDDPAVSKGEIYILRFRMRSENYLDPDDTYSIKLIPKKGDYTEVVGNTADSFTRELDQMWPTSS
jgi:archaellin